MKDSLQLQDEEILLILIENEEALEEWERVYELIMNEEK